MEITFPESGEKYNFPDNIEDLVFIEEYNLDLDDYPHTTDNEPEPIFEVYVTERILEEDPGELERCMCWSVYPIGEWGDDPRLPMITSGNDEDMSLLGDTGWILADNTIYVGIELI